MDISLPVSDSSAAGMFSSGASARSVDSGKFSQTLSKEMTDQSTPKPAAAQADSAQQTKSQQQAKAACKHAHADANENRTDAEAEANASAGNTAKHAEKASETTKTHKKAAAQDTADAVPGDAAADTVTQTQENALLASLKLAGNGAPQSADAAKDSAPSDKASAAGSALTKGSTDPALRSTAAQNEMSRNLRAKGAGGPATETPTYAESLLAGKSVQGSGKNLPAGKADKAGEQATNFLPAGTQDWNYTADALIAAVSDKAAKFDALNSQFNSQTADPVSIFDTGTGKSLAAQSAFKSELAAQDTAYTALTSDFPAGSEEWCQDFGAKIEWMSNEGVSKAELSLHPAELGALDITINTDDDRISINIVTHNEKSREMLESSMPRLTELLKSQGLALENSNISHNSSSNGQNAHPQQASAFGFASDEQQAAELGNMRAALIRHHGQIDHYV